MRAPIHLALHCLAIDEMVFCVVHERQHVWWRADRHGAGCVTFASSSSPKRELTSSRVQSLELLSLVTPPLPMAM